MRDLRVPMPSARAASPGLGALGDLIDHCLIKPKAGRIASAGELITRLERPRADVGAEAGWSGSTTFGPAPMTPPPAGYRTSGGTEELEFASVSLERGNTAWRSLPDRRDQSPFSMRCLHHLKLEMAGAMAELPLWRRGLHRLGLDAASMAELPFDVTLLNLAARPVMLSHVGVEVVETDMRFAPPAGDMHRSLAQRGVPEARKVERQDGYVVECRKLLEGMQPHLHRFLKHAHEHARHGAMTGAASGTAGAGAAPSRRAWYVVDIGETAWVELDDPVYLQSGAPYRFSLRLREVREHLTSQLIVRLAARTQLGAYFSSAIELWVYE